jgi:hypothetical protein
MKPEGARYRVETRVKGLSPEIPVIPVADAFHLAAGNTLTVGMRDCERLAGGLKTVGGIKRIDWELGRAIVLPVGYGLPSPKKTRQSRWHYGSRISP